MTQKEMAEAKRQLRLEKERARVEALCEFEKKYPEFQKYMDMKW